MIIYPGRRIFKEYTVHIYNNRFIMLNNITGTTIGSN